MSGSPYSNKIAELIVPERLMELGPGSPNRVVEAKLQALRPEDLRGTTHDRDMAQACVAGLWLLHDFLDESHAISQGIDNPTGSYWHAIMHRREPDPGNSKYWWRQVGDHPVIEAVNTRAASESLEYRDPFHFVDLCERVRGSGSDEEGAARRVQFIEWRLLFEWCVSHA